MKNHFSGTRPQRVRRFSLKLSFAASALGMALPAAAQNCETMSSTKLTSSIAGSFQYLGKTVALQDSASGGKFGQIWTITNPAGAVTRVTGTGPLSWTPTVAGIHSASAVAFIPVVANAPTTCFTGGPFSFVVTTPPVYLKPKYQIVGVYYSPPGAKSTMTYSAGFTSGTSTSMASSFTVATQVSTTLGYAPIPAAGNSISGTVTAGWSQEKDNSSQITISTQESTGVVVPGPMSSAVGVDHDFDIIWVWLNPELSVSALPSQILVNGYVYDPNDPVGGADVVPIYVGELRGTLPIPADLQYRLQRPWDPATGALNQADYANILAADPFATNSTFNPNDDTSGRYERPRSTAYPNGDTTAVNYIPAPPGAAALCYPYSFTSTSTSALGQGAKDTHSASFSIDNKNSEITYVGTISAEEKLATTLTWTNSWSQTVSNGTSQTASFQICGPLASDNYSGYSAMQVWKDNVYGTFMFYPEP